MEAEETGRTQHGPLFWLGIAAASLIVLVLLFFAFTYIVDLIAAEAFLDLLSG